MAVAVVLQDHDSSHGQDHGDDLEAEIDGKVQTDADQDPMAAEELSQGNGAVYLHNAGEYTCNEGHQYQGKSEIIVAVHVEQKTVQEGTQSVQHFRQGDETAETEHNYNRKDSDDAGQNFPDHGRQCFGNYNLMCFYRQRKCEVSLRGSGCLVEADHDKDQCGDKDGYDKKGIAQDAEYCHARKHIESDGVHVQLLHHPHH